MYRKLPWPILTMAAVLLMAVLAPSALAHEGEGYQEARAHEQEAEPAALSWAPTALVFSGVVVLACGTAAALLNSRRRTATGDNSEAVDVRRSSARVDGDS